MIVIIGIKINDSYKLTDCVLDRLSLEYEKKSERNKREDKERDRYFVNNNILLTMYRNTNSN